MIYKKIIYFLILSLSFTNELNYSNSIFNSAKSPRINALGGCHYLSNNISDVFYNPINFESSIHKKPYFSYYNTINSSIDIFQFSYNILENNFQKLNFGLIRRQISNLNNTNSAWLIEQDNDGIPDYNEVDYSQVYNFQDEELGVLLSYSHRKNDYNFNLKSKPIFHFIDNHNAYGLEIDFYLSRSFKNINLIFGLIDYSYKRWDNGNA